MKLRHFIIFVSSLSIDQLSKYIVRQAGGFYICNKGIAFGLNPPYLLIVIASLAVAIYLGRLSLNSKLFLMAFGLMLSGALSNIIDRFLYGCVIDFIDLKFWPVFNLADSLIFIGAIMIISQNLNLKAQKRISKS